ncbi:hypothetical protein FD30_GL000722 [Levilactobacillus namurensis DSM 19117]|uniref:Uncharacterized protein n=2 Tax=Levilactobacillus namurensis TaxID=380393 RepID=A0A0R1JQP8_9LACO|nr:hypothetical protein [Levilactobacillus namurensis]KRK73464.1 hypothetical protein FD30_GL000722 [Levilactobacillus namurensis DSM 19117]MDT7013993.1 hypothetical protein [Levilactobacillus namurensis]PTM24637.1 hypothetical protein DA798_00805 [Lactobacillus sp. PFC-70]GEO74050.1 hypothetical protein LNA02_07480 [Levilactobacillus namurensis]
MKDQLQLGDDEFAKMMLVLKQPVTQANHKEFKFLDGEMQEIAPDIWAMPAYMTADDDFTMFFLTTQIESGETVVAFATGEQDEQNFRLSAPMITGEGLNVLNAQQPDRAKRVLKFLNDISRADEGNWRMVDSED